MSKYQNPRTIRREMRASTGRMRGGKLQPTMAHALLGSEGGMIDQTVMIESDPIPGRLLSEYFAEMYMVFVPVQAIDAIKNPEADYAGSTDVVRDKLLSGSPLFVTENEGIISRACAVKPRAIGTDKKVNEAVRLAYNAAVNMLRLRAYHRATLLAHTNATIAPALYSSTALQLMNGVLDPDDRVNGVVNLELPTVNLPVEGIGFDGSPTFTAAGGTIRQTNPIANDTTAANEWARASSTGVLVRADGAAAATSKPSINAIFSGVDAGGVSLVDFYNAQKMDDLARVMDQMMRDNPQYGEEMALRWAHGLSVDTGKTPMLIAERRVAFNRNVVGATDSAGVNDEVMRTDGTVQISVSVPVPKTELGGILITIVCVKPDEKLASQPHPLLSDVWTAQNYVADELALDPVPVTVRDLDSDAASGDQATVVMYTGLNALTRAYVDYGFSRNLDLSDVENKTAIWQVDLPLSVNPDNVNYPDYIDHSIFAYPGTEVAPEDCFTYSISSVQRAATPLIFGPTPIENVGVIDDFNLFEEEV